MNTINNKTQLFCAILTLFLSAFPHSAISQETTPQLKEFVIANITCSDINQLDGVDRSNALTLLYGYNAGRRGEITTISSTSIKNGITGGISNCEASPEILAIDAIENARLQDTSVGPETIDLAATPCWDIVLLEGEDRSYALVLLYGYHAGRQQGAFAASGASIEKGMTRTMAYCKADPGLPAVVAMANAVQ